MWNKWVGIELRRPIKQAQCTQTHSGTHIHAYLTNQRACVSGVSGGVVQKARQAKVGDLADQVAVDQDISGGEVSVNIVHVWQILHACSDAAQHPDQLCHCEAPVVQLQARKKKPHMHTVRDRGGEAGRVQQRRRLMNREWKMRKRKDVLKQMIGASTGDKRRTRGRRSVTEAT